MVNKVRRIINKQDKTQKSAMTNLILKPISMVLTLIYTPLLLKYLGDEKYGIWSTMLSIISWVNYCDVGIGHGLRNLLAKELSVKKYEEARRSISTAYIAVTAIASVLLIISLICVDTFDWKIILNTNNDVQIPLALSFIFICINFVLALSNILLYALQISERVALRNCLVQIINIAGLLVFNMFGDGSLTLISILFGSSTLIVYMWNTFHIFRNRKELLPRISLFDKSKVSDICSVGLKFFIINIACIALYTVDNILITNLFGGEATTPFNIVYKVFNSAYAFLAALIVPYWSKTTVAVAEHDIRWLKKAILRLNIIAVIFDFGYVLIAVFFSPLARIWIGREMDYAPGLVTVMCIYYCLYSIVMVNTQFINGTGRVNCQLIIMVLMGCANIPLSIFLVKNCTMGVIGIRLATTILMGIAAIIFPLNLWYIIRKIEKE